MNHVQTMTDAYIEAIYFTETGDGDQPTADTPLTPLTRAQAYIDCRNFYWGVTRDLINGDRIDWSQAGHDLWLTRNGHGTGFWDRDDDVYGVLAGGTTLGTIFTAMAKAMGEHYAEFQESNHE